MDVYRQKTGRRKPDSSMSQARGKMPIRSARSMDWRRDAASQLQDGLPYVRKREADQRVLPKKWRGSVEGKEKRHNSQISFGQISGFNTCNREEICRVSAGNRPAVRIMPQHDTPMTLYYVASPVLTLQETKAHLHAMISGTK